MIMSSTLVISPIQPAFGSPPDLKGVSIIGLNVIEVQAIIEKAALWDQYMSTLSAAKQDELLEKLE